MKVRMLFSEENYQNTLNSAPLPRSPTIACRLTLAQTQKSFGSFLQKRTFFCALNEAPA
jgi:hypothetical protein